MVEEKRIDRRNPKRYRCKTLPKVGQDIYVDTQIYISHGVDDFMGGLAKVVSIKEMAYNGISAVVYVAEHPEHGYFWDQLEPQQKAWKKLYKKCRAHADPDFTPEFNQFD